MDEIDAVLEAAVTRLRTGPAGRPATGGDRDGPLLAAVRSRRREHARRRRIAIASASVVTLLVIGAGSAVAVYDDATDLGTLSGDGRAPAPTPSPTAGGDGAVDDGLADASLDGSSDEGTAGAGTSDEAVRGDVAGSSPVTTAGAARDQTGGSGTPTGGGGPPGDDDPATTTTTTTTTTSSSTNGSPWVTRPTVPRPSTTTTTTAPVPVEISLEDARTTWEADGPSSYVVVVRMTNCNCVPAILGPFEIHVVDGVVTTTIDTRTGETVDNYLGDRLSIEGLLATAADIGPAGTLRILRVPGQSHPVRVDLDYRTEEVDDEFTMIVESFVPA